MGLFAYKYIPLSYLWYFVRLVCLGAVYFMKIFRFIYINYWFRSICIHVLEWPSQKSIPVGKTWNVFSQSNLTDLEQFLQK